MKRKGFCREQKRGGQRDTASVAGTSSEPHPSSRHQPYFREEYNSKSVGWLQVDLIGKGGPPSQEHDVRVVYAKVLGVKIPGAAVESRRLVVSSSLPRENRQWLTRPETIDHGPRFDSSDSEAGEEAYPDFWHA